MKDSNFFFILISDSVIQNLPSGDGMVHKHYFSGGKWLLTVKRSSEQNFCINMFAHQSISDSYVCKGCGPVKWGLFGNSLSKEGWVIFRSRGRNYIEFWFTIICKQVPSRSILWPGAAPYVKFQISQIFFRFRGLQKAKQSEIFCAS